VNLKPRRKLLDRVIVGFTIAGTIFFIWANCNHSIAKDTISKPYSAKTVDECIQEKACVWYAFDLLVTQDYQNFTPESYDRSYNAKKIYKQRRDNWHLIKWVKKPKIAIIGNGAKKYRTDIISFIKNIQPHFRKKVKIQNNYYNVVLIISDDVEREYFSDTYYPILKSNFGPFLKLVEEKMGKKTICTYVPFENEEYEISLAVILIDSASKYRQQCIFSALYGVLTYPYKSPGFSEENLHGLKHLSFIQRTLLKPEISKLDTLLMEIIHSDHLKPGMTYQEVKLSFEEAYQDSFKTD